MFNLKLMTDANNNPISTDNETDFKMKLRSQCTGDCCTAGTGLQHIRYVNKIKLKIQVCLIVIR